MKKREYIVLLKNNGEFLEEIYNTKEVIISIILSKFNKNYDIICLRRGYFFE
jgi:hypothetical protein